MQKEYRLLDEHIAAVDADGYLVEGPSTNSDQYYLSGFDAPDPFVTLYTPDGIHLLLAGMEASRARKESPATTVSRNESYGGEGRIRHFGTDENSAVLSSFLSDHGVERVAVPDWTPVGTADGLRDRGHEVAVDMDDVLTEVRATKSEEEIAHIRRAQEVDQRALRAAEELIRGADVVDGVLHHGGEVLTSERVRAAIEKFLLDHGYTHAEFPPVVACGTDAADPHLRGSGPLRADETILIDVFPRDKETKYHGDLTRTFVHGTASDELEHRYEVVLEAQEAALAALEPGVEAESVHDAACDVFEAAGFDTVRSNPHSETGFIHRTGHGIGLDVHENPRLSSKGGTIREGHVVTVEPGLYDPAVGGVRIEDLVVVREDGYENLTDYEKTLEL